MNTILSVENARSWSWGVTLYQIISRLHYKFIRIVGMRPFELKQQCKHCKQLNILKIKGTPIAEDLIDYFDMTMLQNVCSLQLVRNLGKKILCRFGGLIVNDNHKTDRYDKQLQEVGAIIATNKQLFDIGERNNKNTFLIPNGVDLNKFKPADQNHNTSFTVGFAGNIWGMGLHYKGYKFYVEAVTRLYSEVKHKQLLHAHSQIPHEEMPEKFYHKIDCLVLPSQGEGCSNVITEALACGVPVLCTKVGYHGEFLKDRINCIFIERDIKDIMDKIMLLKNNFALRMDLSVNGRKFAEENHDINKIAKEYDKVFKLILKNK